MQAAHDRNHARIKLLFTCLLFGTIGTLVRYIGLPSSIVCLGRAVFAVITIAIICIITKRKININAIKRNLPLIVASGACMCINWVSQFEAFRYTTIATATLCYYMQPIFFILAASVIFKETLSTKKTLCVVGAFCGMILVSGVIQVGFDLHELKGAIFAIIGAIFYAIVVLLNKGLKDIEPSDSTMVQLAITSIIMFVYVFFTEDVSSIEFTSTGVILLIILGVVHTGIGYVVYFSAVQKLDAQTLGIISYIDPVEAVILSALVLHEPLGAMTIAGAILILGATAISELSFARNRKN